MTAVVDLDTSVYLRTSEIRAFTPLDSLFLTHSLTPPSVMFSYALSFPPQPGDGSWSGKVGQKVASVCAV